MDFYIKSLEDNNYYDSALQISDPLSIVMQKLEMVLFTDVGEVLGATELGCSLEMMLFELNFTTGDVQKRLDEQIRTFVDPKNEFNIVTHMDVVVDPNANSDVLLIDIRVNNKYALRVKI